MMKKMTSRPTLNETLAIVYTILYFFSCQELEILNLSLNYSEYQCIFIAQQWVFVFWGSNLSVFGKIINPKSSKTCKIVFFFLFFMVGNLKNFCKCIYYVSWPKIWTPILYISNKNRKSKKHFLFNKISQI